MITVPTRLDLIKMLPPGSIGAEIGVYRGGFTIQILNECPVGKVFAIDAWENRPDYIDTINGEDQEENLRLTKHHLRGHLPGGRVEIIRGRSVQVALLASIPPLDWVYIDADHSYVACSADLAVWSVRLKPTGIIMGHDWTENATAKKLKFGVKKAVKEFCETYGWEMTHVTDEDFASYRLERIESWRGAEL